MCFMSVEHASLRKVDSLKLGVVFEAQGEKDDSR
jgi:hypothetical protein